MSEGADTYIYNETYENEVPEKPFTSREIQIIYDVNNGTYTNQIIFSTQALTNGGKWADFSNSYIEVPFTLALSSSVALTNPNMFMAGLKDGSIQIIDSIICQYNGTSVSLNQPFTNIFQHFKIISTWSKEDLTKWGDATVTSPDETSSMHLSNGVASAFGDGTSNNQVTPFAYTQTAPSQWVSSVGTYNEGYLKRLQTVLNGTSGSNNDVKSMNITTSQKVARNTWTASGNTCVWNIMLTLRLKDLSSFFCHLPILKASRIDLTINFNAAYGTFTYTPGGAATTDGTLVMASYNQTSGHSCPFMVSSAAVYSGASNVYTQPWGGARAAAAAAATVTIGSGINGVTNPPAALASGAITTNPTFTSCRWFVPMLEMNPEYEQELLLKNPIKTIHYDDFYTFTNISAVTGTFSSLLTAGVKNPKYVVIFPFFNNTTTNSGNALAGVTPYQSFWDTAPATPSPVNLTNFQVQVGGRNMFNNTQQYNFQQYIDEFSEFGSVNGGKSDSITSGLLSYQTWQNAPIYVCNVSRRLPQDDGSPKSIQITATVNSNGPTGASTAVVDLVAFVVFGRSCSFNLINGLITNMSDA